MNWTSKFKQKVYPIEGIGCAWTYWYEWFAWRPVVVRVDSRGSGNTRTTFRKWIWLEKVWRQDTYHYAGYASESYVRSKYRQEWHSYMKVEI